MFIVAGLLFIICGACIMLALDAYLNKEWRNFVLAISWILCSLITGCYCIHEGKSEYKQEILINNVSY